MSNLFVLFVAQSLPLQYYIYFLLPIFLWWSAVTPFSTWVQMIRQLMGTQGGWSVCIEALCYILGSFALVRLTLPLLFH